MIYSAKMHNMLQMKTLTRRLSSSRRIRVNDQNGAAHLTMSQSAALFI